MNHIPLLTKWIVLGCVLFATSWANAQTIPPIDQLKPGETVTIKYDVTVNGGTPSGTVIANTGTVTANNAATANTNTVNMTVVVCPPPTITASGPTTFCAGGSVTLTSNDGDPLDPSQTWQWYKDGIAIGGATTSETLVTESGNYYVEVTNTCAGTISSSITTVTVNALSTGVIGGTSSVCTGGTGSLEFTVTGAGTITVSYSNSNGDAGTVTGTAGTFTASVITPVTPAAYTYTITSVEDANGCVATATSGTGTVTVNPRPQATISGSQTVCAGGSVTLTIVPNGAGTVTVTIRDNPFTTEYIVGGTTTFTTQVSPPGTGTVTYFIFNMVDANGCQNFGTGQADIFINDLPTAIIGGTVTACIGGTASLSFTLTGAGTITVSYINSLGQSGTVTGTAGTFTGTVIAPSSPGAATYTITSVVDANGCVGTNTSGTGTVTGETCVSATISGDQTICAGGTPTLTFSVTGTGTVTVTYQDSNGGATYTTTGTQAGSPFTHNPGPLSAGTHTFTIVSVEDQNATVMGGSGSATVLVNPLPTAVIGGTTSACTGSQAALSFTVTGAGTITVSYINSNGDAGTVTGTAGTFTATVSTPITPGAYTYTITGVEDANGCTGTSTSGTGTVTVNALPTATLAPASQQVCFGGTASITVMLTGSGSYSLTYTVTDGITTTPTTVPAVAGNTYTIVHAAGAQPGTYTYTVTSVQDLGTGCFSAGPSNQAAVIVNALPTGAVTGNSFVCVGGTASLSFTLTGAGVITVSYVNSALQGGTVTGTAGTFTASVVTPPVAGVYTYTITQVQDANGCVNIVNPGSATVTVGTGATLAPPTQTLCNGQTSSITVTFFGTPPFNYDYRIVGPTAGQFTDVINASSATYTTTIPVPPAGTTAGTFTYTVTQVRDANGCVGTGQNTATVIVNPVPNATFTPTTQTICQGSTATVTINFIGQAPFTFTYTVHNGSTYTVTIAQVSPTNTYTLTLQPPGAVQPGTYTYTIDALMDGNGCTGTVTNTANIIVAPLPTAVISGTSTVCAGDQAQASFTVTGAGTITVSYINNLGQTGTVTGTAGTFTGTLFTPGNGGPGALGLTYTITSVQDANGCVGTNTSGTATVTVNPLPTAVIAGVTSTCTGSMATLTFTVTGTGPITVTYNNSAGQVSSTSFPAAGSYSQTVVTPVPPGAYTYTITSVTDATGCTGTVTTGTGVVTVHPLPTAVYRAGTASQTVCAGTFTPVYIDLTGVAPNTYSLTYAVNGNPTTVAVVGNTYTITAPPAPGSAGTYTYTIVGVQDLTSGCSNTSTSTATVTVKPLPTAVIGGTSTVCTPNQGSLTFTVTGAGTITISYTNTAGQNGTVTGTAGTFTRTVLTPATPGLYTYTITNVVDANGCVATNTSGSGTVMVNPLPTVTITPQSPVVCYGSQTALVNTFTGTPPFTYYLLERRPDNSTAFSGVLNAAGMTHTVTLVPSVNMAGVFTYTVVSVTDANGCSNAATSTATITMLPQFTITSTVVPNPVCNPGTTTATITPSSIPGTPPLVGTVTYTLTGPVSGVMTATGLNPVSFPGLTGAPQPGGAVYTVTAVNANGCVATHTFTVIQNPPISGNIIGAVNPTCPGASDGSYHIPNISGGYPPYQVSSNGGVTYKPYPNPALTTTFTGLPAGIYVTFVRDALGCVMPIGTVTLQDPTPVTLGQPVVTDQTCATAGTITIRAQGGTGSYTYTLTAPGGATTQQTGGTNSVTFSNLTGGSYTVTVQDSNNCPAGGVSRVVTVAGGTPDLLLTSSINPPIASFPALGSQVSITYTISSKNGIASNAIIVRVTKPFSGYTMVLAPGQPNSWTDVTPGGVTLFKEYQLNGAVPCAGSVQLVVVITRSGIDSPSTGVPITAAVRNAVNPDPNDFDNARASQFRVQ